MTDTSQETNDSRCHCPQCGSSALPSMGDLRAVISSPSSNFSSDLASWLSPPQRPNRPVSRRRRTGRRNSIAFGLVLTIICFVAWIALAGSLPNIYFDSTVAVLAIIVGRRTWLAESKLADKEEELLQATHIERFRAYLQRRRVWSRLRFCAKCGLVIDPATHDTSSLFEVHELANRTEPGVRLI